MIVELRAVRRRRPRRAVIIHSWITHDWPVITWAPEPETIFEANTFVRMLWPRGPEAWDMVTCRYCNREFLWDKELSEKCPSCPHCWEDAAEFN